ncbi:MAG: hypothetical protein ACRDNH_08925 [Gaiellaceae bacterium]
MDEHSLPFLELAVDEESLPGAEPGERERRTFDVVEVLRLGREVLAAEDGVLGCGSFAVEVSECEDGITDLEVVCAGPDAVDDARELVRRNRR